MITEPWENVGRKIYPIAGLQCAGYSDDGGVRATLRFETPFKLKEKERPEERRARKKTRGRERERKRKRENEKVGSKSLPGTTAFIGGSPRFSFSRKR